MGKEVTRQVFLKLRRKLRRSKQSSCYSQSGTGLQLHPYTALLKYKRSLIPGSPKRALDPNQHPQSCCQSDLRVGEWTQGQGGFTSCKFWAWLRLEVRSTPDQLSVLVTTNMSPNLLELYLSHRDVKYWTLKGHSCSVGLPSELSGSHFDIHIRPNFLRMEIMVKKRLFSFFVVLFL